MCLGRIIQGVHVDYTAYIWVYGRTPRGEGNWCFFWGRNGEGKPHFHYGTFPQARRAAVQEARAANVGFITVGS